jgi:hypothetical protein
MTVPIIKSGPHLCDSNALYAALCRKQLKIRQVQKEIKALNIAIVLLSDDENELSRSPFRHPESETRPWPIRAFYS